MECKLVFYCALVLCLKHVASLPSAFNVPRYPIANNDKASQYPYVRPQQQYWNQQLHNADRFEHPQEYRNTNHDPNLLNRRQEFVPNYLRRHPVPQKILKPKANHKWPTQHKWQNFNRQPIERFPEEAKTVTQKKFLNDRGNDNSRSSLLSENTNLKEKQVQFKNVNKVPLATGSKLHYPLTPEIPIRPINDVKSGKYPSTANYLPVVKPIKTIHEKLPSAPLTPDRYFATSANPVETYDGNDHNPASKKNLIRQLMSNTRIRDMMAKNKSQSTKSYLVVYPNGTMERVNTLQSIAEKHPNYVLVHAGDFVVKENSSIASLDLPTKPPVNSEQHLVITPRIAPSNKTNTHKNNTTATTENGTSSLTTELPLLRSNTTALPSEVLLTDPLPKFLSSKPPIKATNQPSHVDTLPQVKTMPLENSTKETDKLSQTSTVSSLKPISKDLEAPIVPNKKVMSLDIPPRTIVKVSLSDGPAVPNIEEISLDTNTTEVPLPVKPSPSELDTNINQVNITPEKVPLEVDKSSTASLPFPLPSIVEPEPVDISDSSQMTDSSPERELLPKKQPVATDIDSIALPVGPPPISEDTKISPVEISPRETETLVTVYPPKPILADIEPKQTVINPILVQSKPPIKLAAKAEVTGENQSPATTIAPDTIPLPIIPIEEKQTNLANDNKISPVETFPRETETLVTVPPQSILADVDPKQTVINPIPVQSKPPIKLAAKAEVNVENQSAATTIAPDTTPLPIISIEEKQTNLANDNNVSGPSLLEQKPQGVPKAQQASSDLPINVPSISTIEVTTKLPTEALSTIPIPVQSKPPIKLAAKAEVNVENQSPATTIAPDTTPLPIIPSSITDKTPVVPVESVAEATALVTENNDMTVLPGPMNSILINAPKNNTLSRLPGHLDISKVNTVEKPLVWFKSNDESFWDKLADGNDDLDLDIVYFFQINSPAKIENSVNRTIYPNGTVIEEITKSVWEPNSDVPTITKTTNVINPDV